MKIKFIGVPGERHESVDQYGVHFPLGKAVDVSDPTAMRKLRNHQHFEVVDDVQDVESKAAGETRAALEADAAAAHIKVDGRWSDDRLREEIAKKAKAK